VGIGPPLGMVHLAIGPLAISRMAKGMGTGEL